MRNRAETPAPPNIYLVEHAAAPHLIAIGPAGSQIPGGRGLFSRGRREAAADVAR
jgi:hypothetical protein